MNLERFGVKFFAHKDNRLNDAIFIEIFQEWIRLHRLNGILLDVVDYRHVAEGPGVMLITHDINFAMDYTGGRFGLLAQRKQGQGSTLDEKIVGLVRAAVEFAALLEADPRVNGQIKFDGGRFEFFANDRLLAPNTDAAFEALRPAVASAGRVVYADAALQITRQVNDPRERLTALVNARQPVAVSTLAERLALSLR